MPHLEITPVSQLHLIFGLAGTSANPALTFLWDGVLISVKQINGYGQFVIHRFRLQNYIYF